MPIPPLKDGYAMNPLKPSRRWFLKASAALPLAGCFSQTRLAAAGPLIAYVGTFSSPLRDMLPTQVDLPPGNGRGIHLFQVDRASGALNPHGVVEMGTSPSCLALNAAGTRLYSANETDRVGDDKQGSVSAFAVSRADGTCWWQIISAVPWRCFRSWPTAGWERPRTSKWMPARPAPPGPHTPRRAASPSAGTIAPMPI